MPSFLSDFPLNSIIFLCWNRWDDVREVLARLRQVDYQSLKVILMDNASRDGTSDMVAADFPEVELISMPSNLGIAGYNASFAAARGKFWIMVPEVADRMVAQFLAGSGLGMVGFGDALRP
jgi:GT2 family glycosyltransferase